MKMEKSKEMDLVRNLLKVDINIKDILSTEKRMEEEKLYIKMEINMMDNGMKDKFMALEDLLSLKADRFMKDFGKMVNCVHNYLRKINFNLIFLEYLINI